MSQGAYLFAAIDTATARVVEVRILSEQRPSVIGGARAWGFLHEVSGGDFAEAQQNMLRAVQAPWLRWVLPFLQRHAPVPRFVSAQNERG
jgi:hypothetical protein